MVGAWPLGRGSMVSAPTDFFGARFTHEGRASAAGAIPLAALGLPVATTPAVTSGFFIDIGFEQEAQTLGVMPR